MVTGVGFADFLKHKQAETTYVVYLSTTYQLHLPSGGHGRGGVDQRIPRISDVTDHQVTRPPTTFHKLHHQ